MPQEPEAVRVMVPMDFIVVEVTMLADIEKFISARKMSGWEVADKAQQQAFFRAFPDSKQHFLFVNDVSPAEYKYREGLYQQGLKSLYAETAVDWSWRKALLFSRGVPYASASLPDAVSDSGTPECRYDLHWED